MRGNNTFLKGDKCDGFGNVYGLCIYRDKIGPDTAVFMYKAPRGVAFANTHGPSKGEGAEGLFGRYLLLFGRMKSWSQSMVTVPSVGKMKLVVRILTKIYLFI